MINFRKLFGNNEAGGTGQKTFHSKYETEVRCWEKDFWRLIFKKQFNEKFEELRPLNYDFSVYVLDNICELNDIAKKYIAEVGLPFSFLKEIKDFYSEHARQFNEGRYAYARIRDKDRDFDKEKMVFWENLLIKYPELKVVITAFIWQEKFKKGVSDINGNSEKVHECAVFIEDRIRNGNLLTYSEITAMSGELLITEGRRILEILKTELSTEDKNRHQIYFNTLELARQKRWASWDNAGQSFEKVK